MIPKLDTIETFLKRLDLKTDRIPTLAEYKASYRKKLNLHPDKGGEECSEAFKEITDNAGAGQEKKKALLKSGGGQDMAYLFKQ